MLVDSVGGDFLYTKTTPLEWFPDNKGGGASKAVATAAVIEQWVTITPWDWRAVRIRYKISYVGKDPHSNYHQEMPAVYANAEYNRFVYYGGMTPWTNGPVTDTTLVVPPPNRILYTSEKWLALANESGFGLTVFVPQQYPYGRGRFLPGNVAVEGSTSVFYQPLVTQSWAPGMVVEGDYILIPGDVQSARKIVYAIRDSMKTPDHVTPFGYVDLPKPNALLSGVAKVGGWVIDNDQVSRVDIFLDGILLGSASYGIARPDVPRSPYRGAALHVGYEYVLDTRRFADGGHTLEVIAVDRAGNRARFNSVSVRIRN